MLKEAGEGYGWNEEARIGLDVSDEAFLQTSSSLPDFLSSVFNRRKNEEEAVDGL